jgi:hypothetical protein
MPLGCTPTFRVRTILAIRSTASWQMPPSTPRLGDEEDCDLDDFAGADDDRTLSRQHRNRAAASRSRSKREDGVGLAGGACGGSPR